MSHYLPDAEYDRLIDALMQPPRNGLDPRSHLVTTLGELADIWPEGVRDDAELVQEVAR